MTAEPKFAARLPPPEMASARKRLSFVSSSVKFHEPAVWGTGSLLVHSLFQPGRQWPGRTAHPPIARRRPRMQTLVLDLFAKLFLMEQGVLKDGRMNGRGSLTA